MEQKGQQFNGYPTAPAVNGYPTTTTADKVPTVAVKYYLPSPVVVQPGFRHGLFDCCGNCGDCLFATFLPECYAFVATQDVGEGTCCALLQCLFYPLPLCFLRRAARNKKGLNGGCCTDVLASCCCPCCTLIQIRREYRH